jgi:hypothetical protein
MSRIHWVARGTGIPKDRDEVNRREVCETYQTTTGVYLQLDKKKARVEGKQCHTKSSLFATG